MINYDKMHDNSDSTKDPKYREAENLRKLAFFCITVSTIATLTAIIVIPMVYSYMQHVQSSLQDELDYCQSQSELLYNELQRTIQKKMGDDDHRSSIRVRERRGATVNFSLHKLNTATYVGTEKQKQKSAARVRGVGAFDGRSIGVEGFIETEPQRSSGGCCSCGVGLAGPPGQPGIDGQNGNDGSPGSAGSPGADAPQNGQTNEAQFCFDCPAGPAGPAGQAGAVGARGQPGNAGADGIDGQPGASGSVGPSGPAGLNGVPGLKGPNGEPGQLIDSVGPSGPPGQPGANGNPGLDGQNGSPGNDGAPGLSGEPGDAGNNGRPGQPGLPGVDGVPGENGGTGGCSHCPPPRTAPGYHAIAQ